MRELQSETTLAPAVAAGAGGTPGEASGSGVVIARTLPVGTVPSLAVMLPELAVPVLTAVIRPVALAVTAALSEVYEK